MNKQEIIKYAQGMNCAQDVFDWINKHLAAFLEKNNPEQGEIEHIIDYLASDQRPGRLAKMSYEQAKSNTDKWNKALAKKGKEIKELESDIDLLKDFGDGFRIVKLIGESAYKREGFLMGHCVASYFGKNKEVYSLRDAKNMPHATLEKDKQIKGKGNGPISPKYIHYIVEFLKEIKMPVGDSEMKNLGYYRVDSNLAQSICDNFEDVEIFENNSKKYLYLLGKQIKRKQFNQKKQRRFYE